MISTTLQQHWLRIVNQGLPKLDLPARAQVLTTLAQAHIAAFDKTRAGILLEQALDIYRSREELDSPAAQGVRLARAQLLIANNDLHAAQREYAALIAALKAMNDPDLRSLGIVSMDYALVLDLLGRSEESVALTGPSRPERARANDA